MFVGPRLVEVEWLWVPHTPLGGVVGDVDQVVAVVVDIACTQGGRGGEGRESGEGEGEEGGGNKGYKGEGQKGREGGK